MDFGSETTYAIPRKADLIKNIFLQFELPNLQKNLLTSSRFGMFWNTFPI